MRYVPIDQLNGRPNIIVDGYPTEGTVLTLSHWPGSGSPPELAADLSTQIAFRYLDTPSMRVEAEAASNNHFDQDGLCGLFTVLYPEEALARRERLIDVASAGDFEMFRDRNAAHIAIAIAAFEDEDRSPIAGEIAGRPYPEVTAALYSHLLERLPDLLDHPDRYSDLWEGQEAKLAQDEAAVRDALIRIEERPEIDLAVVTVPEGRSGGTQDGLMGVVHPMAIHNATGRHRILVMQGRRYALRYRYETWVNYVSAPTMPRVDLASLADRLSEEEGGAAWWIFDGVQQITPALRLTGDAESRIPPERFRREIEEHLERAAVPASAG